MFEFAGDVSRKDVKNVLMDMLEDEWHVITEAEDNGMALRVDIDRNFTPYMTLEYTDDRDIRAEFIAVPITDDYDTTVGCRFQSIITNAGLSQKNAIAAEKKFYRWYQFTTMVKLIAEVDFYPFDYFD